MKDSYSFRNDFKPNCNHFYVACSGKLLLLKDILRNYDNKVHLGDILFELR